MINKGMLTILALIVFACSKENKPLDVLPKSICNPVDLSYRFRPEEPSRREAADPTVVFFKGEYYLFASKSGGYWFSKDLSKWNFVKTSDIPTEDYAPTAIAINDTLYLLASVNPKIYKTTEPKTGKWEILKDTLGLNNVIDPAFFQDDDGRLYLYWGCSNKDPLYGIELDFNNNFATIGETVELKYPNPHEYGWEVCGDYNTNYTKAPWIEGSWMNKHNGVYYLQYSGPGTEYKSYSDGVYTSKKPLGPFELEKHNPFAYKPEGFACGAGHGSTFMDEYGNYWHMGTVTISMKHMFERRLCLYPTFFDKDGVLHSITKYGDYPFLLPTGKVESFDDVFPGWMLLSFKKEITVSSLVDSLPASNMVDENIRTYWSAESGSDKEWASIDLGKICDVYAIQVNFAEHDVDVLDRQENIFHRYIIESSIDGKNWEILCDESKSSTDNSHNYHPLVSKQSIQYVKIKNIEVPDGKFAISGLRVFGKGNGDVPDPVKKLEINRNVNDKRSVVLRWNKSKGAVGYNINFGINKQKLYHNYLVYSDTSLIINSLNAHLDYYFSIEAFNENGASEPIENIVDTTN